MAPLPASVQYGLSSESNKDNKELVFVKLTDSALKAIEEFLKNKKNGSAKPKIQFLPGNEGQMSIPSPASGEATFNFSINSNAEMENAQGSFECVTSGGAPLLESCGPLPRRMRVHASEDSYATTWNRMASAVTAKQSKCTRKIKPNQTDSRHSSKARIAHASSFADATQLAERAPAGPEKPERQERVERLKRAQRPVPPAPRLLDQTASRLQLPSVTPTHHRQLPAIEQATKTKTSASKRPISASWLDNLPAGDPSMTRGAAAAASVSLLPDVPPLKKQRASRNRRTSSSSSGYATTSSGERQAEDKYKDHNKNDHFRPVAILLETSTATEVPIVANDDLDYLKNIERSTMVRIKYPPITNNEIRQAYKNEYAKLYLEYITIYNRLAKEAALFTRLEGELRSAKPSAISSMEQRIRDEYRRVKNDPRCKDDRNKFESLHEKLVQLKLMVYRYDIPSRQVH